MTADDDWGRWGHAWQDQPAVDVQRLRGQVECKYRQMRRVLVLRSLGSLVAVALVIHSWLIPELPLSMKAWFAALLLVALVMFYLRLRQYGGTWRSAGETVSDLLQLTAKRARAGIRLAWISLVWSCAGTLVLPALLSPWLMPSRWPHNPTGLQHALLAGIAVNALVQAIIVTLCILYMRRQKRRLRNIEAMLAAGLDAAAKLQPPSP